MQTFTNASEVDVNTIKQSDLDGLARALLNVAETVMARPGMQERFEQWKRKRGVSQNAVGTM